MLDMMLNMLLGPKCALTKFPIMVSIDVSVSCVFSSAS